MMKKKSVAALLPLPASPLALWLAAPAHLPLLPARLPTTPRHPMQPRVLIIPPLTTIPRISKMLPSFWTTLPTPTTQVCMSHWIRAIIKTLV